MAHSANVNECGGTSTAPTWLGVLSDRQRGAARLASTDRAAAACLENIARQFDRTEPIFPFGRKAVRAEIAIAPRANPAPSWSTSTFSNSADTSPMELSELGEHLDHCKGAHGRLFTLRCVAETLNGFLASRLVTTLVVAALLIGVASLAV